MGYSQAVRHQTLTLAFRWSESSYPSQKSESLAFGFFICVRRTQHRLSTGQHHFERSENFIVRKRTQINEVTGYAVNEVVLRTNEVDLRPMMLRRCRKCEIYQICATYFNRFLYQISLPFLPPRSLQ